MSVSTSYTDGVVSLTLSRRAFSIILRHPLCLVRPSASLHPKHAQVRRSHGHNTLHNSTAVIFVMSLTGKEPPHEMQIGATGAQHGGGSGAEMLSAAVWLIILFAAVAALLL